MVALVCVEAYKECVAMFAYRFYRKRQAFFGKIDHDFPFRRGRCPACVFKRRDRRDRLGQVVRSKRFRVFLRWR